MVFDGDIGDVFGDDFGDVFGSGTCDVAGFFRVFDFCDGGRGRGPGVGEEE